MAIDEKRRGAEVTGGDLLRRRLVRAAKLLADITDDINAGFMPADREEFILHELERGESLSSIGELLGVSKQRVLQIAQAARARSSNGS
jgi:hypothetical protein